MTSGYPLLLDLHGRLVVVVGGGGVAARKVSGLLEAGGRVVVISPALHPRLAALDERIEVRPVAYAPGMLTSLRPLLVFAATDSRTVNQQVADEARELGILVSVADEGAGAPAHGDFASMAVVRRGSITLAAATDGASPALAAHLRDRLEAAVGEEYATLARWLGDLRPRIRAQATPDARRDLWRAILDSPVLDRLRAGDEDGARAIIDQLVAQFEANSIL